MTPELWSLSVTLFRRCRPLLIAWALLVLGTVLWETRSPPQRRRLAANDMTIYASSDVVQAPVPSLRGNSHFDDARGTYERRCYGDWCVNLLFTRKGFMRSGDLHRQRQVNHIISGSVKLTQRVGGEDVAVIHHGAETVILPAHTPHLYEFLEDTLMTEYWIDDAGKPAPFKAWLYKPYRDRISAKSLERPSTGLK